MSASLTSEQIARVKRWLFSTIDFEAGELVTHAQSCLRLVGYSDLAVALNAGVKVHNAFAATVLGLAYDEFNRRYKMLDRVCIDMRQAAKPGNFGFPGRMGAGKFVIQQRSQGPDTVCENGPSWVKDEISGLMVRGYKGTRFCVLMDRAAGCGKGHSEMVHEWKRRPLPPTCRACLECAERLRDRWFAQWSEMRPYFDIVAAVEEHGQVKTSEDEAVLGPAPLRPGQMIQHGSRRIRGGCEGNSIANGWFQGLLSEATKDALADVQQECTDETLGSVLYGSRVVLFAHDELIAEHPEEIAHEAGSRVGELMVASLRRYCPDLLPACAAEPALMARMYKGAQKVTHSGRMVAWTPEHDARTCGECRPA